MDFPRLRISLLLLLFPCLITTPCSAQQPDTVLINTEAETLTALADSLLQAGDLADALEPYSMALEIYRQRGDRALQCETLNQIGEIHRKLSDNQTALGCFQTSLNLSRDLGDRVLECEALRKIGLVYYYTAAFDQALEIYHQGLVIARDIDNQKLESKFLNNIAITHGLMADFIPALKYMHEALAIAEESGDEKEACRVLINLGVTYCQLADYPKALEILQRCLETSRKLGSGMRESAIMLNLGTVYYELYEFENALEYFQKGHDLYQADGDRNGQVAALTNIGVVHSDFGDFSAAAESYRAALKITEETGNVRSGAIALLNLGTVSRHLEEYEEALEYHQQSLAIFREVGDQRFTTNALLEIGADNMGLGDRESALQYYQDALIAAEETGAPWQIRTIFSVLGDYYLTVEQPELAVENFARAIAIAEEARGKLDVEGQKTSLASGIADTYGKMVVSLHALGEEARAFDYMERSRARSFLDLLASGSVKVGKSRHAEYLQKEGSLESAEEMLEPELASLVSVNSLSLSEVQSRLDTGSTIAEYFVTENALMIWLITENAVNVERIEVAADSLKSMVMQFRDAIVNIGRTDKLSTQLFEILITPVHAGLATDDLIIIPHDILHYLPFQALQDADGKYLIEDHRIRYLPSASVLKYLGTKRHPFGEKILVFANPATDHSGLSPIPYSEVEAEGIAAIYDDTRIFTQSDATEDRFRATAADYDILHLACHSELSSACPLFSGLLLAPGNEYDGELNVHELFTLELNAWLVILSACETGLGHLTNGDELVGLARAFIYAGTPSILSSLWMVDDESSAYLMAEFYRNLKSNNKAEAIRQAQLQTKKKYPNLNAWASFVLVGDAH